MEWRVFEHHQANGNPVKKPKVPRPPVIKGILHNGFRDQIKANKKPLDEIITARAIENLLGAMVPSLFGTAVPEPPGSVSAARPSASSAHRGAL